MWMVVAGYGTGDFGTLGGPAVEEEPQIVKHRVENAPLNRFQTIANVG